MPKAAICMIRSDRASLLHQVHGLAVLHSQGTAQASLPADFNILLELLASLVSNSLLWHTWKLIPHDVMHMVSFTRLPLFSHSRAQGAWEPGDDARCMRLH